MDFQTFLNNILSDLKVELKDEFDRNFQRKAFFDEPWPSEKMMNTRGSLLMRTGNLRNSIEAHTEGDGVRFTSTLPYADIQNNGGTLTVTAQMKKFFWAMYYKTSGNTKTRKDGTQSRSKRNMALNQQAQFWKNLALMKVGDTITIPPRRFIGRHPQVDKAIEVVLDDNIKELHESFKQQFKQ